MQGASPVNEVGAAARFVPVFVVGAPRSGTTWLQNMLGAHEHLCAPQETGLFHNYLNVWQSKWLAEMKDSARPLARRRGLPSVLTGTQFHDLLHHCAVEVYSQALEHKPAAGVLLDKEPSNTFHIPLIADLFPDARFIHLIRDGRDVATSLIAAHRSWASDWAPGRVADAARTWQEHVRAARRDRPEGFPYVEIRYEELLADPVGSLLELFGFAGIDADRDSAEGIAERFSFEKVKRGEAQGGIASSGEISRFGPSTEPPGFYRSGTSGTWRTEWSPYQRAEFDRVAGGLLVELGYAASRGWSQPTLVSRITCRANRFRERTKEAAKSHLRVWIAKHPSLQSE